MKSPGPIAQPRPDRSGRALQRAFVGDLGADGGIGVETDGSLDDAGDDDISEGDALADEVGAGLEVLVKGVQDTEGTVGVEGVDLDTVS